MGEIIRLENVCKSYFSTRGELKVLDQLNMKISNGEFVSIVGQSGSGKSTLMNILGCLDRPTSGHYYLDGNAADELNDRELTFLRSRVIGFVFQSFHLIPTLTAAENVELPLLYRGMDKQQRRERTQLALERVGLGERMDHRPHELSGGQQQRVAIARAIAAEPPLLLCDEPTGSLDQSSGREVMGIIEEMNRSGVTVVLITHDEAMASRAGRQIRIYPREEWQPLA